VNKDFLEVIPLDEINEDVEELLDLAKEYRLEYALVLGQDPSGQWFFAASDNNNHRAMFTVEAFRSYIMDN
jgi:hypothetical protein